MCVSNRFGRIHRYGYTAMMINEINNPYCDERESKISNSLHDATHVHYDNRKRRKTTIVYYGLRDVVQLHFSAVRQAELLLLSRLTPSNNVVEILEIFEIFIF